MRLVCCYVEDQIKDETVLAIEHHWGDADFHVLSTSDPNAYVKTIAEYWQAHVGIFIVEPDIVIRPDVVEAVLYCDCDYGCFPYEWLTNVGPALGCTWFRSAFMRKYPRLIEEVLHSRISWKQFDVFLMRHLLARKYKEQPHVHLPPVEHLNEHKHLLPSADATPMMEVPSDIGNLY